MDFDNDDKDDSKRKSRNLSEKKRRDQFNMLVNELSSMVSANNRKMDKSTVLKSTIAFLKNHNEVSSRSKAHEIQSNWKPPFLSNEEFTHLILEALDGFIMVFSSSGRIYYASEGITSLLGYIPTDLLSMSIYELVYKDDQTTLYNILLNPTAIVDSSQRGNINPEHQLSFSCYIKRGDPDAAESYEPVQFVGYFRSESDIDSLGGSRYASSSGYNPADNRVVFVGTGRLQTPQLIREMSIANTKSEFTSRHSLEWKFLFLDHRAPPIIGYLPFEVLGTSGYDYYHFDDLEKMVTCHEALMQKGEGTSCFYRFLTKGQQWIWLQTRFYITYHQWNSKPEFVVCTHRVVSYADAMKQHRGSGSCIDEKENEVKNSTTSVTATSPWSKSSRASKLVSNPNSPKPRSSRHRYNTGTGSDSTSMSADSPSSCHYSVMSHISSRSKGRSSTQPLRQTNQSQSSCSQPMTSAMPQPSSYFAGQIPMTTMGQMFPPHSHHRAAPTPSHMLAPAPSFMESPQYVAAIPVQPAMITAPFPSPAVIQPLQPTLDYLPSNVVLTPAQNQIQDHLQRKHEELQHLIQQQQEELRRVSEQLMMARYGIVPGGNPPFSTSNSPCDYGGHQGAPQQALEDPRMHPLSQISDPGGGGPRTPSDYLNIGDQMIGGGRPASTSDPVEIFQMQQQMYRGTGSTLGTSPNANTDSSANQ